MTAKSIGTSRAGGYARYLESKTIAPEIGDYYLAASGEPVQAPGRWLASAQTLARLGIEGETVHGQEFIALMEGRHPRTGEWLRPEGAGGGRLQGAIDQLGGEPGWRPIVDGSETGKSLGGEAAEPLAGVSDQGQISKLLSRLQQVGVLENTGGVRTGQANTWRLTAKGARLQQMLSRDVARPSPS